jgi:hypothetical protein
MAQKYQIEIELSSKETHRAKVTATLKTQDSAQVSGIDCNRGDHSDV